MNWQTYPPHTVTLRVKFARLQLPHLIFEWPNTSLELLILVTFFERSVLRCLQTNYL
jgi:hypothetical protein